MYATREEIQRYREENCCSLIEANAVFKRRADLGKYEHLQNKLRCSRCWQDVRDVLEEIVQDRITELT